MFKLIGTISNALMSVTNSVVGITKSLDNVIESANSCTNALRLNAQDLEAEVAFECTKKTNARAAALIAYEQSLLELSTPVA